MKEKPSSIILDLDNTLYDFSYFFGPAFREMIRLVKGATGITEQKLYDSARKVIETRNSIESRFIIYEMDVLSNICEKERRKLAKISQRTFDNISDRLISNSMYPNVIEVLKRLSSNGHFLVGLTNASIYQASKRIEKLGLAKILNGLVACENSDTQDDFEKTYSRSTIIGSGYCRFNTFPFDYRKPSYQPFKMALDLAGNRTHTYMVGDNIITDVRAAQVYGITSIWAKYGNNITDIDRETLLKLTPSALKRDWSLWCDICPDHVIDNFSDLERIIGKFSI